MRGPNWLLFILTVLTGCLLFNNAAMGQGCGYAVVSSPISCCGNNNHPNSDCSNPFGDPNNYCYLSYGNCCDVDYSLANTRYSDKCLPIGKTFGSSSAGASYRPGILLAGICSGGHVTSVQSLIPAESEGSHVAFVIRDRLNLEAIQ